MFGREAERAQTEQLLERAADGPVGLALEGAPGIGKTTVWRQALDSARNRGYRVIVTAPAEPDAALGFAGLGDLFEETRYEVAQALPAPQRNALAAALSVAGVSEAPADPLALGRAVLTILRLVSATVPVIVAVDDEQWLDPASARVLAFALCRLRDQPVGVILTRRPQSTGTLWRQLATGFGTDGLPTLTLGPLDLRALDELLRAKLNRTIPRPLLRRIHAASGGSPLYALALARELDTARPGVGDIPIPATLAEAIARRLRAVDARAQDPMLAVAAMSRPNLALVQAAVPAFALSDLESAVRAEVIEITGERIRFTHPLLASVHYARTPASRRRELHRVLAEVLEDEEERARHLALAAEAPDRRIALALEQAAGSAARRGAADTAALLLEDAVRLTPIDAPEARVSRVVAAAEHHSVTGSAARARELLEELMPDLPGGPIRARALMALAEVRSDDFEAGHRLLAEAMTEAAGHDRVRAQIESRLALTCSNLGRFADMLVHAQSAIESAEHAGDSGLLAMALTTRAVAAAFNGHPMEHELLRRAIELEATAPVTTYYSPSGELAQILFWSDDYERARPQLQRSVQRARRRGEEYDAAALVFELAMLEWYAGNRDAAELHLASATDALRAQGEYSLDLWLVWGESLFIAGRGDLDEALEVAARAVAMAEQSADLLIGALPASVLASVRLWTGRPEAAHAILAPIRESFVASGFGIVGSLTLGLWTIDIEALIASGALDDAQLVVDELRARVRASENPNAVAVAERCRGLLLAARGDLGAALEALELALTEHARRPLAPEVARTSLELGTVQRRTKRKNLAKHSLELALATFEPIGARMWADRARDELGRIGLRRPVVSEGLTPAQTRVADLVLEGLSNREIAGALYMSVRSVEAHLTKAYRELGVRSRAQLVATLSADRVTQRNDSASDG